MRILLGSSSSYRKKILTDMFPDREIEFLAPDIDEKAVALSLNCTRDESPPDLLTQEIALAKARKCIDILAQRKEDSDTRRYCIITGDQVAVFRGKIREKPSSEKVSQLSSLVAFFYFRIDNV